MPDGPIDGVPQWAAEGQIPWKGLKHAHVIDYAGRIIRFDRSHQLAEMNAMA
jgi:hypothetical protein